MKRIIINILQLLLVGLLFSASCKKNTEPIKLVEEKFTSDNYPVKIGNWWKYKVTDFYSGTIDTLVVEVVSEVDNSNGSMSYRCELKQNGSIVDSSIIIVSEVEFSYKGLNPYYSYFGDYKLTFPFNAGSFWEGAYSTDTVIVTSRIDKFTINGTEYSPIYNLKRSFYLGGGYSLTQFQMITPKVGIVNQSIDLFDGANAQKQNFDLIDYHLN
tara:strand:+ start:2163 stop:2801 length:639 start_codon:yes stop_codon:yes gene_type:complete